MSYETFLELNLVRHGSCIRCGDCCREVEFEVPKLWVGGRCRFLLGDECVVWGSDECPEICRDFPLGTEDYLFKKWLRGERLDFKPLLPNCPFWFEIEESSALRAEFWDEMSSRGREKDKSPPLFQSMRTGALPLI